MLLSGFSLVEASRGSLLSILVVLALLIVVASLIVDQGLLGVWALVVAARRLSSCGSRDLAHRLHSCGTWASLLRGMSDLPRLGIEPVSPALADDSSPLSCQGSPQFVLFSSYICLFVVEFQEFFMYLKHFYPSPFIYLVYYNKYMVQRINTWSLPLQKHILDTSCVSGNTLNSGNATGRL